MLHKVGLEIEILCQKIICLGAVALGIEESQFVLLGDGDGDAGEGEQDTAGRLVPDGMDEA